jgi:hypothetical protein
MSLNGGPVCDASMNSQNYYSLISVVC